MQELLFNPKFQLIKRDLRQLKSYIFSENEINNWNKIIILYNFFLFYQHLYYIYYLLDRITNENYNITNDFKNIFIFFFILCNLKNSYLYLILNISKIDKKLAEEIYKNSKEYFC